MVRSPWRHGGPEHLLGPHQTGHPDPFAGV